MDIKPVLLACAQLSKEGKEASIALIKQKLPSPLPLKILVKGKSYFMQNKSSVLDMLEQENKQNTNYDNEVEKKSLPSTSTKACANCEQLSSEIARLKDFIKALQVEVEALKNRQIQ